MHAGNAWGGSFDVARSPGAVDNDDYGEWKQSLDLDRAAMHLTEETTQQSWLLHPGSDADNSKKKAGREIDLGCVVCSRKLFKSLMGALAIAFTIAVLTALIVELLPRHHPPTPPEDNYTQALHKVLLFFNAQKSGKLPMSNNISWRGDSGLKDGFIESQDLVGGYYDAGDNIKFGFPGAFTITLLSWSVIEYRAKYESIGEYDHVKELIKWGADYMLKTFNVSAPSIDLIWAQVGSGGAESNDTTPNDHTCWERPEDMDYPRHAYSCGQCSDLAAEMAAAMAAASIVFKNSHEYSSKLLTGAQLLFDFSRRTRGRYSESISKATRFYNSSGYWDEFVWGGAWMYYATGNSSYLKLSTTQGIADHAGASRRDENYGVFNWDNKLPGAQVLLTRLRILLNPGYPYENLLSQYNNETNIVMCSYLPVYHVFNKTKGGLMQFNHGNPAPLQYASAAAFLSALYADYLAVADIPGWNCGPTFYPSKILRDFARSQIDYILGDNALKMSYVVGYGQKYPLQVHHRGASIPKGKSSGGCTAAYKYRNTRSPNPHILTGAMVAGPDAKDRFIDLRTDFNYTEPTIAGNAMLAAALIALSSGDTVKLDKATIFSNIPPLYPASPPPPSPWKP